MGGGLGVKCEHCGYHDSFSLGVGFLFGSLENVRDSISSHHRNKVLALARGHDVRQTDFYLTLCVCDKCHGLYERLHIRIEYGEDGIYETAFRCPRCKTALRNTGFTQEGAICSFLQSVPSGTR